MSTFGELLTPFFGDLFRLFPVLATALGNHDHDGSWPDPSGAGVAARLAHNERWAEAFAALPEEDLSRDESIDREVLLARLAADHFFDGTLREDAWNPLGIVHTLGEGIHLLLAREFAPPATRLASVAERIEGMPAFLAAARARLGANPDRPVSRLHAQVALEHLPGIAELCNEALALAAASDDDGELATIRARLEPATSAARAALDAFAAHLRSNVIPGASGEGRLGPALFAEKMRHALGFDITPDTVDQRARREFAAVRAEMVRIARAMWPDVAGMEPAPADDGAVVRAVLDRLAADHPAPDGVLAFCRSELVQVEAFCREHGVVELTDEPLSIEWTPTFLRSFAGAMLLAPGPLDRGLRSYFYVTPTPPDWTPEQVESYLREDNDRMLRLLVIHEAVPGHHLQGVHANRNPSLVRGAFASGTTAEGWAVYVTQVMMDRGYGAGDPGLLLTHWKFYLRAVANAILDVGVHARDMTREEAMALLVDGAFQEASEALKKYERARLSSTQLCEYFVGSAALWDIEEEARRRAAAAAGADGRDGGRSAVPAPRVVGGYGETPGFDQRAHLAAVLAAGAPPIPALRRILFGEPPVSRPVPSPSPSPGEA